MTDKTKEEIAEEIKQETREADNGEELLEVIEKAKEEIKNHGGE